MRRRADRVPHRIGPLENGESELFRVDVNTLDDARPRGRHHGSLVPCRRLLVLRDRARLRRAPKPARRPRAEALAPQPRNRGRIRSRTRSLGDGIPLHPPVRCRLQDPQQRQIPRRVHRDRGENLRHRARRGKGGWRRVRRAPQGPLGLPARVLQTIVPGLLDPRAHGHRRRGRRRGHEGSPRWARARVAPRERHASLPAVPAGGHEGGFRRHRAGCDPGGVPGRGGHGRHPRVVLRGVPRRESEAEEVRVQLRISPYDAHEERRATLI
mmetsp:Transcript_12339/g.49517  ORF Transcript_12339/g.49517 Transcript_12339/m.49517 type:complete len:269 (-) Transcript_12339:71-877(-)